jgi:hypothetical protein
MIKNLKLVLAVAAVTSLSATASSASSPQSWAALEKRVKKACIAASGLRRATVVPDKASFSDAVPIELRVVEGYNAGFVIDVQLCAFDRRTGRAATVEGSGRLGVYRD